MQIFSRALASLTPTRAALLVFAAAFATIAGAWVFEWAGYAPCDLCLKQRWAYYVGVPLAALAAGLAGANARWPAAATLSLLALIFAAGAVFGAWHAGIEWGFWKGPEGCTGAVTRASDMNDFLKQLETVKVVRCDAVAIRILGLSLAGWNAVISTGIACLSALGACRALGR
jgi:disulfide bond formation protein DsbB